MEIVAIFFMILVAIAVFSWKRFDEWGKGSPGAGLLGTSDTGGPSVQGALRKYGVTVQNHWSIGARGTHDDLHGYQFRGVDKAGVEVTGQVWLGEFGPPNVTFDDSGAGARAARAQDRLRLEEEVDETTLDLEERVRRELARRLDAIQGSGAGFLSHDTDGDGMVDSEEWTAVRTRVEAEIRAEFAEAPSSPSTLSPPPPTDSW